MPAPLESNHRPCLLFACCYTSLAGSDPLKNRSIHVRSNIYVWYTWIIMMIFCLQSWKLCLTPNFFWFVSVDFYLDWSKHAALGFSWYSYVSTEWKYTKMFNLPISVHKLPQICDVLVQCPFCSFLMKYAWPRVAGKLIVSCWIKYLLRQRGAVGITWTFPLWKSGLKNLLQDILTFWDGY